MVDSHRLGQVGPLGVPVDLLVGLPTQPMASNFMTELTKNPCHLWVSLHRLGDGENGQRHAGLLADPQHPPHARPRSVFVERLHAHVPVRK